MDIVDAYYVYIYIYTEKEREREREKYIHVYAYIYIYIYIYIETARDRYIHTSIHIIRATYDHNQFTLRGAGRASAAPSPRGPAPRALIRTILVRMSVCYVYA